MNYKTSENKKCFRKYFSKFFRLRSIDMRFSFIGESMTSARFIEFVKKLRKDAGRPIMVIGCGSSETTPDGEKTEA